MVSSGSILLFNFASVRNVLFNKFICIDNRRKVRVRGVRHDQKREHLIEENAAPSAAEADAQPIPSSLKRLMDARSSAQQPRPKRRRGQTSAFTGASRGQESAAAQLQRRPGEPRAAFLKRAERDAYRRVEEAHVRLRIQH